MEYLDDFNKKLGRKLNVYDHSFLFLSNHEYKWEKILGAAT